MVNRIMVGSVFAISLIIYVTALVAERHIAWHRREGWLEPKHPLWEAYWNMTPRWRRHRYNPEHYEFSPRIDRPLSIIRRMARIVAVVSGAALLARIAFYAIR